MLGTEVFHSIYVQGSRVFRQQGVHVKLEGGQGLDKGGDLVEGPPLPGREEDTEPVRHGHGQTLLGEPADDGRRLLLIHEDEAGQLVQVRHHALGHGLE